MKKGACLCLSKRKKLTIVKKPILTTPSALTITYFKIVKKGTITIVNAKPKTTIDPGLFLSFQRDMENVTE